MKKRYAVTIDLFIYAKDDDSVRRKSAKAAASLNKWHDRSAAVIEIKEVPFGVIGEMRSVKLDSEIEI